MAKLKTIGTETDKDRIQKLKELFQVIVRFSPQHKLQTIDRKINDDPTRVKLRD